MFSLIFLILYFSFFFLECIEDACGMLVSVEIFVCP